MALGRHGGLLTRPLSNQGLNRLVRRAPRHAGITIGSRTRTSCAPTTRPRSPCRHVIARRLAHTSIQTTSRYRAEAVDESVAVAAVLDRHTSASGPSANIADGRAGG